MYSDVQNIAASGVYGPVVLDTTSPVPIKAIWLSVAGAVEYVGFNQTNNLVLPAVPAGQWIPVHWKRINTAATTATISTVIYGKPAQY